MVLFTSYAGEEFKLDGDKKVLLMREDDILAVIELSDRPAARVRPDRKRHPSNPTIIAFREFRARWQPR